MSGLGEGDGALILCNPSTWQGPEENRTKGGFSSGICRLCFNVSRIASAELDYLPPQKNPRFSPPRIRRLNSGLTTFSLRSNWQVLEKVLDCHNPVVRWQMFA